MSFKDHFSKHSQAYSRFRPGYPSELFDYIFTQTPGKEIAWDCATGNGQAAIALTERFDRVIATDASQAQIHQATPHPQVEYRVAPAENSGIAEGCVDLVTVAQALHWFNLDAFFKELTKVAAPNGTFAAWGYSRLRISPSIDRVLDHLYHDILGKYWPPERVLVEQEYDSIEFPFERTESQSFSTITNWDFIKLLNYLLTWSSSQRFLRETGNTPTDLVSEELRYLWGPESKTKPVTFPVFLKIARIDG